MIFSSLCMERECIDYTKVPESRLSDNCFLDEWPECGVLTDRMLDAKYLYKLLKKIVIYL